MRLKGYKSYTWILGKTPTTKAADPDILYLPEWNYMTFEKHLMKLRVSRKWLLLFAIVIDANTWLLGAI